MSSRVKTIGKYTLIVTVIIFTALVGVGLYTGLLPYFIQLASGHIEIITSEKPILDVIRGNALTEEQKNKLELVLEVRKYASDFLDLPNNKSYTLYSDIQRRHVGWNIYAAPKYSVEPHSWCFPITGCIVYRGFLSRTPADAFAKKVFLTDALEVYIGPINAYSTLGFLNDPILSSNLYLEDFRLASLVIHELTHQRLYIPSKSKINEAFAVVVEREGLRRWLAHSGRQDWLPRVQAAWDAEDQKVSNILSARSELKSLYASSIPLEEKEAGKRRIFGELKDRLCGSVCAGKSLPKANDEEFELNNAYLVAVDTYYGAYSELSSILKSVSGDLKRFYAKVGETYR